ncbi:MAG: hypothetical protein RL497_480 [Pseudomonadota bacterium]|jgi:iron complex outermembrane receptor protein
MPTPRSKMPLMNMLFIACWVLAYSPWVMGEDIDALSELSLEELLHISVTAQRREQVWVDVPASLDVLTERRITEEGIFNLSHLADVAPGYVYGRVGDVASSYVRGIGSSLTSISADASTAVYLDDVYLSRPEMTLGYFWDMKRVELLKGPQGALYGRNATGGVVNLAHNQAEFKQVYRQVLVGVGAFNERRLEAVANQPLGDKLAARVSVFSLVNDGFTDNLSNPGGKIDDQHAFGARTQLAYQFNTHWESRINVEYFQNNNHGFSIRPNDHLGLAELQGVYPLADFHATENNVASFSDYKTWAVDWRLNGELDFADVQVISAYRRLESGYLFNTDGTAAAITESGFFNRQKQMSHEIRLLSHTQGTFDWLAGFYALRETPQLDVVLIQYPRDTSSIILADASTLAHSLYGEINWHFMPSWSAKLGVRNTHEKRQDTNRIFATGDLLGLQSPTANLSRPHSVDRNERFNQLSPQVVLSHTQRNDTETTTDYLSITEGFKSGGSNSLSTANSFDPEEVISYELGRKYIQESSAWSLSAFYYDYNDLQVLTYERGVTAINNAASAKIFGIEGTFTLYPTMFFNYQLGFAWLHATYEHFISSINGQPVDVSGNQMPYAPEWDINQKFTYSGHLNKKMFSVSLLHHFQSETAFNQFEAPNVTQQAYHTFDLVGEWAVGSDWSLTAGMYNITDRDYYRNIVSFTSTSKPGAPQGNALGFPEAGRSWALGMRLDY